MSQPHSYNAHTRRTYNIQHSSSHHCQGGSYTTSLAATAQAQHQVECGLLLNVVVCQGAAILQLLAGKDQALLVWGDACRAATATAAKNCQG
jgi:hypothetical protein